MDWWNQVTAVLNEFFNSPIVVTLSGVATAAVVIFTALAKTSVGKKAIAKMLEISTRARETGVLTLQKVKDVELLANDRIDALNREYETKCAALISIVNYYEESVFTILNEIPNAKVKAKLVEFKEGYEETKKEIYQIVGLTYQDYKASIEEVKEIITKDKDEEIAFLSHKIDRLEELLNSYINKPEESENGTKEEESQKVERPNDSNGTPEVL